MNRTIVLTLLLGLSMAAFAHDPSVPPHESPPKAPPPDPTPIPELNIDNTNTADANANADSASNSAAGAYATINQDRQREAPTTVMVQGNSTAQCVKALGVAHSDTNGSTILGIPLTAYDCHYDKNADNAKDEGNVDLEWWWRCHKRASWKPFAHGFGPKAKRTAIASCYTFNTNSFDAQSTIDELQRRNEILTEQVAADHKLYSETMKQLKQDCAESNARALRSCQEK